jgi:MYXO-CTERM domain-containing protein
MRKIVAALSGAALLCASSFALSNAGGVTGRSGKQAGQNCNGCHTGGLAPVVNVVGPAKVDAGATANYRFYVEPTLAGYDGGDGGDGGLEAGPPDGGYNYGVTGVGIAADPELTLIANADGGTRAADGELTHIAPMAPNDAGESVYHFSVTAPQYGGYYTIYLSGNAANGDNAVTGDQATLRTFTVQVLGPARPSDGGGGVGGGRDATGGGGNSAPPDRYPGTGQAADDGGGCAVATPGAGGALGAALVLPAIVILGLRRRRRAPR